MGAEADWPTLASLPYGAAPDPFRLKFKPWADQNAPPPILSIIIVP